MARAKKSLKRIQGLMFLMLLTMVLAITATYAWFSTQRDVEIAGMRINVEVAENLQISLDGEKWAQSIQVANMRQLYGSYTGTGDSFTIYQANPISSTDGNTNYVPTELLPVSSAGEVSGGKLQFVQGTLATSATGTTKLEGITACSEDDLTLTETIANRQLNNEDHPYLVFDMYLRNISAKTAGVDELKLNEGSAVWVNVGSADDDEQEGDGVGGTGLEYSARVGMIVYGNTMSVTAGGDTLGEQIRGLTPTGTEVAAIWEPNDKEHTAYVVSNNGRGIDSTTQAVTTYGIKVGTATATPNEIADINSTTDTNLVAVNTFKPGYTTVTGGTDEAEVITNTKGNNVGLAPNQISKVRVYVWLEGQDPDCVDLASTGDKLNINLKLTKDETNSTDKNTYVGDGTGSLDTIINITAATLTASDYGGYVTNYESIEETANGANIDWRIFHSDGENIYLIAEDYIELDYVPAGKSGTAANADDEHQLSKAFYLNALEDYEGSSDIPESHLAKKWLSKYTYSSTNVNIKATAYLMDTNQWSGFADSEYAEYAIGSPTVELFAESYNKKYTDKSIEIQANETGYQLKWSTDADYGTTISLGATDSLYVITDTDYARVLWLASPASNDNNDNNQMYAGFSSISSSYIEGSGAAIGGSRPVVCLNSSVQLEKQANGSYLIVE